MRRLSLTRILSYTPDQMFALVGDVKAYPQFVPWLASVRVWNEAESAPGVTRLDAEAGVGFSFLKETFASRVSRDANSREIVVSLLYGPFKRLRNRWAFLPHPQGTQVDFEIDFEFKSRMLDGLLSANMDRAVNRLIACFEARAAALHGVPASPAQAGA